jgi:predicted PurR-regulated permease PerM
MKTWAIVIGVLLVLFCLGYLVRHPSKVDRTVAKVFPHNGAETP